ncbi:MAG: hypothetical protein ABI884_12835 [Gemmatimonadota bacterium]
MNDVFIADLRADVQIAQLCETRTIEGEWKLLDREIALDDLEPARLDLGGVGETADGRGRDRERGASEEGATIHDRPTVARGRGGAQGR